MTTIFNDLQKETHDKYQNKIIDGELKYAIDVTIANCSSILDEKIKLANKVIEKHDNKPHASPASPRFDTASQIYLNWKKSFLIEFKKEIDEIFGVTNAS